MPWRLRKGLLFAPAHLTGVNPYKFWIDTIFIHASKATQAKGDRMLKINVLVAGVFVAWSASPVLAQIPPGEDPLVLNRPVSTQMLPTAAPRASTPLESPNPMPSSLKAKIVRYEAKASSTNKEGILTDSDVVRSASSDGFKKTCVQEVGSNTAPLHATGGAKPGFGNNEQIVVLKGDLVNICR